MRAKAARKSFYIKEKSHKNREKRKKIEKNRSSRMQKTLQERKMKKIFFLFYIQNLFHFLYPHITQILIDYTANKHCTHTLVMQC